MDIREKQLEAVRAISNLNCLIVEPTSAAMGIQKVLSGLGAGMDRIEIVTDLKEARAAFKAMPRDILFIDYALLGPEGFDLLDENNKHSLYESKPTAVFLISAQDSAALAASAAESCVDFVFSKPFTLADLDRGILDTLQKLLNPTKFEKHMQRIKLLLASGDFEEALPLLELAKKESPTSVLRFAFEGIALWNARRIEDAKKSFHEGLRLSPKHYRCLVGLFDLCSKESHIEEAHKVAREISSHHTVPVSRIPDFIRVYVKVKDMDHVIDFYHACEALLEVDTTLASHLAAGLTLSGAYLLSRDAKTALDSFAKAEKISKGADYVMETIVVSLTNAGFDNEVKGFLSRSSAVVKKSLAVSVSRLQSLMRRKEFQSALDLALKLIEQKMVEAAVYDCALRSAVNLGWEMSSIRELVESASKAFPEQATTFKAYLNSAPQ